MKTLTFGVLDLDGFTFGVTGGGRGGGQIVGNIVIRGWGGASAAGEEDSFGGRGVAGARDTPDPGTGAGGATRVGRGVEREPRGRSVADRRSAAADSEIVSNGCSTPGSGRFGASWPVGQ